MRLLALGAAAVLSAWYLAAPGPLTAQVITCWVAVGSYASMMSYFAFRAGALMDRADPRRRFWRSLGLAAATWAAGEWAQIATAVADPDSVAALTGTGMVRTIALSVGCLGLTGVVLTYPVGHRSARARLCYLYDLATVVTTAGAYGLCWAASAGGGSGFAYDMFTVGAAPVVAMLTAFAIGRLYLSGAAPFRWPLGVLGPFAAGVEGLARGLGPELVRSGHPGVIFALTVTAHALLMMAAWAQYRTVHVLPDRVRDRPYSLLPYVALAAGFALLVGTLAFDGLDRRAWIAVAGVVIGTGIVVARQLTAFVANAELLAERDALAGRLHTMAFTDSLTGLSNRALFLDRLGAASRAGVLLIDLDDFKPVNDVYGHAAGDAVLVEVAARLRAATGPDQVAARFGGDEFAVLATDATAGDLAALAERIVQAVGEPCRLPDGRHVRVHASIGVATGDGRDATALLHAADQAMYAAKCGGKGSYRLAPTG
ncbi:hypothetical protein ACWT_4420 [Actinoplanes sp. SE50]|uniref:GGDEF domain-containing protein n=1 Tax=unclassified Actinoplanes TaxID=2626549 RepID=UPI00023ECCE7|nr:MULTISPECIES: GGDEF domain-containing protein [unclassified Actinoplanes]AEV85442.1 uncharacterized protein ACPL_4551 [Actinoplanes sp. SE50/110]ATO83835.1 hypothetical protein ACWT_4420 [Actinoplanes sp. SE50]SLM01245.1 hypothetical protein ACSP50_4481 [Actinoplanes sp. SE50/110]